MSRYHLRSIIALSTVLMMGLVLAAPLASAAAEAPEWEAGDGWAVGRSVDLDAEFAQELSDLEDDLDEILGGSSNGQVNRFDVQATAAAYALLQVAEANEEEVVLQAKAAAKLTGDASISITADMDAAGTYEIFETPAKEAKTVALDVNVDLAAVVEIEVVLEASSSTIKSVEVSVQASAKMDLQMDNVPSVENNFSANQKVISYSDYDVEMDFDFHMSVMAEFAPALDLFSFPLEVGDEWTVDSNVTISGTYGGSMDLKGLPAEATEEFFDNEMLEEAGVTSFPIDFAEVFSNDNPSMHNGTIGPQTYEMDEYRMHCVSADYLSINGWSGTRYTISVNEGESTYHYFDGGENVLSDLNQAIGEIAEEQMEDSDFELPMDIPLDDMDMQMQEMSVADAERQIEEISEYQAEISGTESGSGIAGLDTTLLLALVGIMAAVLVVVVVLLVKRKPKAPL